jgi:hypothetical protein
MVLFSCESTIRKPRPDGTKGELNMVGKERGWQTLGYLRMVCVCFTYLSIFVETEKGTRAEFYVKKMDLSSPPTVSRLGRNEYHIAC